VAHDRADQAQKPLGILKRIIKASSNPDDLILDFFAGSGTTGEAAYSLGRRFLLIDKHDEAIRVMRRRFARFRGVEFVEWDEKPGNRGKVRGKQSLPNVTT
jgi:site-specific DNA-methyltransferase (adenine-specific)